MTVADNVPTSSTDPGLAPGEQPKTTLQVGGTSVTLLGTAHVSRLSAQAVKTEIITGLYDAVAIELCPTRHRNLERPDDMGKLDMIQVLRDGKAPMVAASLALAAYQQRLADQFGIEPGADMRAAMDEAKLAGLPVLLVDRDLGTTLKRCYRSMPFWQRMPMVLGLISSVMSKQEISEEQIEKLKEGDVLETTFNEFAENDKALYGPLIDERDRYMAAKIRQDARLGYKHILAVVGAGHMKGIKRYLEEEEPATPETVIEELESVPPGAKWPKLIPWFVAALVIAGFVLGFLRNPDLGWQLIIDWTLINGGLAGIGAIIALAHPVTIITSALAAPLTSLNPTIGVGFVAAAVEALIRKPSVGDFSRLRQDTSRLKGWWQNRVSRVLLVFVLTTLGSASATYIAGFKMVGRLTGG
ncbi:MAG: conjugal transfer protein TraB [Alteromonadaceae bacterium]|nr:conjugal transfer protein TraB [Alteromonadaceae bacterium]